ncbi:MAG: MBL fold metallo-hydrolase [Acetatifactor sp.]|nr:MBL fold metallo-hydrolase [Acetatifactor sp.]MDE7113630.1 MBL fold metallo-hydrolase [Acetatifactor sp.]
MMITYLGHSGFLVEFRRCYCIFDYYVGELPCLNTEKPVFVFVSHAHADHYNPEIFALLHRQGMTEIAAVLSKDIPPRRRPEEVPVHIVTFHQSYELSCDICIHTLHSTDRGVAYLLKHDGCVIYHAGDLNDWSFDQTCPQYQEQHNRQMAGSYRHEIDLLREQLGDTSVDAAFLPLDPRLGTNYANGFLYFLKKIRVKKVYPMHYWDRPDIVSQFLREYPQYGDIIESSPATAAL